MPLSRLVIHIGDVMCSARLNISALSLWVDRLPSYGALVIASMNEIRRLNTSGASSKPDQRSPAHTESDHRTISEEILEFVQETIGRIPTPSQKLGCGGKVRNAEV